MNESEFDYSLFFPDPQPVVQFIKWLAESYQLPTKIELLDVGCGFGRTLFCFNELDWKVTALEPDSDFYVQAKRLESTLTNVRVRQGGFLDIDTQERFDMVVAINDPFAYLTAFSDRIEALRLVHQSLKKGGVLLVDVPNFFYVLANPKPYEQRRKNINGQIYRRTTKQSLDFHENTWTNTDDYELVDNAGKSCRVVKSQRLAILNYPELDYLLKKQGFAEVRTYTGYDARMTERLTGKRILISAQKPLV